MPTPDAAVIREVRASCALIADDPTRLSEAFYQYLFTPLPGLRAMFAPEMADQHRKMGQALMEIVQFLDHPDLLRPYLYRLGALHGGALGVRPEHYPYAGRALVQAVRDLSPAWSSITASSWVLVYEWVSAMMLAGAESARAAQAGADAVRAAQTGARADTVVAPRQRPWRETYPRDDTEVAYLRAGQHRRL
ncbi:MAG: globin domain-containing protein [Actinocatenispora sp.]